MQARGYHEKKRFNNVSENHAAFKNEKSTLQSKSYMWSLNRGDYFFTTK